MKKITKECKKIRTEVTKVIEEPKRQVWEKSGDRLKEWFLPFSTPWEQIRKISFLVVGFGAQGILEFHVL